MKALIPLLMTLLLLMPGARAYGAELGEITTEVSRADRENVRLIHLWWLPVEYWVEAARSMKKSEERIDEVRRLFQNYMILAIIDAEIARGGGFDAATHQLVGPELVVTRNGQRVEILHDIDPTVAQLTSELSYFLKTSLAMLGPAIRIFFLKNVDAEGLCCTWLAVNPPRNSPIASHPYKRSALIGVGGVASVIESPPGGSVVARVVAPTSRAQFGTQGKP